jgi:hypothetical protein
MPAQSIPQYPRLSKNLEEATRQMVGQVYGLLTVKSFSHVDKHGQRHWLCLCICRDTKNQDTCCLTKGITTSCGCITRKVFSKGNSLIGRRFGRLEVKEVAGHNSRGERLWLCSCDCGNPILKPVKTELLLNGAVKSCGCLMRDPSVKRGRPKKPPKVKTLCAVDGCQNGPLRPHPICRRHYKESFDRCSILGCEGIARLPSGWVRRRDGQPVCAEHARKPRKYKPRPSSRACCVPGCTNPCVEYARADGKLTRICLSTKCADHRREIWRAGNSRRKAEDPIGYALKKQAQREGHRENAARKRQIYRHTHPEKAKQWSEKRWRFIQETSDGSVTPWFLDMIWAASKQYPYCDDPYLLSKKSFDHRVPLEKGGKHVRDNLHVCCLKCNVGKKDRYEKEWIEMVRRKKLARAA